MQVRIFEEPWAPAPEYRRSGLSQTGRRALGLLAVLGFIAGSFVTARFVTEATLGQCAPSWLTGTDPQLCINASIAQRVLTVSGTTSLADGSIVQLLAEDDGVGGGYWTAGPIDVAVSGGSFRRTFDVSDWGAGTIVVTVQFAICGDQPQAVIDRYGGDGSGLRGPDVQPDPDRGAPAPQVVESSIQVDLTAY